MRQPLRVVYNYIRVQNVVLYKTLLQNSILIISWSFQPGLMVYPKPIYNLGCTAASDWKKAKYNIWYTVVTTEKTGQRFFLKSNKECAYKMHGILSL